MKLGEKYMKLLEINNKKGYYYNGDKMVDIKNITADDLLTIVQLVYSTNEITCDEVKEDNFPDHVARTIYMHLYTKIEELKDQKSILNTEWDKYLADIVNQ